MAWREYESNIASDSPMTRGEFAGALVGFLAVALVNPAKALAESNGVNEGGLYGFEKGFGYRIDKMANYDQGDTRWAHLRLGFRGLPMAAGGCGPTAMAMVVSTMKSYRKVSPPTMGRNYGPRYFFEANQRGRGDWDGFARAISKDYELSMRIFGDYGSLGHNHLNQVARYVKNGGLVVALADAGGYFTSNGHFIVIRAHDSRGFRIADPAGNGVKHNTENKAFTSDFLLGPGRLLKAWGYRYKET